MDYKLIPLTQGKFTKVDASDFEYLNQWKWHLIGGYAVRREGHAGRTIYMQRLILNVPERLFADHINRDRLDNTRKNLRICTRQQNNTDVTKRGINQYGNRWYAQIMKDGKNYAKTFIDKTKAIEWYNYKARELHGEFAVLIGRSVL